MKSILLSILAFCIITTLSIPTAEASSELPTWIKKNASWWADDKINDKTFLDGIEYMLDNLIIQIPTNQKITPDFGMIELDKFVYDSPKRLMTTEVFLSGQFKTWSGNSVSIEIVRPDGKIENVSTRSSTGNFDYVYVIKSDFPLGEYQISAESVQKTQLGIISFKLNAQSDKTKTVPTWVKNNAGWWADDQIDDNSFISGLKFLIEEGLIKVEKTKIDRSGTLAPDVNDNLIMYETRSSPNTESFSVIVVNVTHDDYCSQEENKETAAYGKMAEFGLKKNLRDKPVHVLAICMKLDEIKENTYPLVLQELGANRTNMMIFVGDIEANFESYQIKEALGWWHCQADYTSKFAFKGCGTHLIVVCDECTRPFDLDEESVTARGMEILIHEIGHHNLFEANFGPTVFGDSLHRAQAQIDYCREGGILESNMCKKIVEHVPIMGKTYTVMNLKFLKNNWQEIDRINETSEMTNWINCKISNYEKEIFGSCIAEEWEDYESSYTEILPPDNTGLPYLGSVIELDKIYYTLGDDVNIVVVAPNFNRDSTKIDYIGTDGDNKITISTSKGKLDFYKLEETFPDSGIFTGMVSMEGGSFASTSGVGPWSGKIKADYQDTVTVEFSNTYSGEVDTVSTQGIVQGTLQTTSTSDYKKYTDDNNRFTIEYSNDWVLADSHPEEIVSFQDDYDWKTNFQIFLIEGDTLDNRPEFTVLRAIEENQRQLCDEYTFAGSGNRKCTDFKLRENYTTKTNDGRMIYFVKITYTLEWENWHPDQQHSIVKTVGLIYDGNNSWEMAVESFEYVFDENSDQIMHMMKSFSFK